ncbi:MAG TPA: hypothetical protein VGM64_08995 [Lacunisphaera sp.]
MNTPHGVQSEHVSGCLIVRITGRDFVTQKEATFKTVANAVKERPIKALLVDLRGVEGTFSFMDRYQIGEMTARHLADVPIGALCREEQLDRQRIAKLVAVNRGANVEVFIDEGTACAWLKKYQDTSPS